jgi:hypothetical protein
MGLGVPAAVYGITTLGLVAAILAIVVAARAVLAWRQGVWTRAGRVHYTLVALAALAFAWQLSLFNLLGYHF